MEAQRKKVGIHFECSLEQRKEIKMFFAALGETMADGILKSIQERKERIKEPRPNFITRKTLEQSRQGVDVTEYKTLEDIFEEWGI